MQIHDKKLKLAKAQLKAKFSKTITNAKHGKILGGKKRQNINRMLKLNKCGEKHLQK